MVTIEVFERERCYLDEFAISAPLCSLIGTRYSCTMRLCMPNGKLLAAQDGHKHVPALHRASCERSVCMHVLHACGSGMWLRLTWPVLTHPVRCAAEVCFGNGQYDHCGVDRRRRNYWVRASWLTGCKHRCCDKQAVTCFP